MNFHLPYFAVFYVAGVLLFALFIRLYLRNKRTRKQEELLRTKLNKQPQKK